MRAVVRHALLAAICWQGHAFTPPGLLQQPRTASAKLWSSAAPTTSASPAIEKAPNDYRDYGLVQLDNGMQVRTMFLPSCLQDTNANHKCTCCSTMVSCLDICKRHDADCSVRADCALATMPPARSLPVSCECPFVCVVHRCCW